MWGLQWTSIRISVNQSVQWKVSVFFFRGSCVFEALRLLHVLCAATHSAPSLGFEIVSLSIGRGACATTTDVQLLRPKEYMHRKKWWLCNHLKFTVIVHVLTLRYVYLIYIIIWLCTFNLLCFDHIKHAGTHHSHQTSSHCSFRFSARTHNAAIPDPLNFIIVAAGTKLYPVLIFAHVYQFSWQNLWRKMEHPCSQGVLVDWWLSS